METQSSSAMQRRFAPRRHAAGITTAGVIRMLVASTSAAHHPSCRNRLCRQRLRCHPLLLCHGDRRCRLARRCRPQPRRQPLHHSQCHHRVRHLRCARGRSLHRPLVWYSPLVAWWWLGRVDTAWWRACLLLGREDTRRQQRLIRVLPPRCGLNWQQTSARQQTQDRQHFLLYLFSIAVAAQYRT